LAISQIAPAAFFLNIDLTESLSTPTIDKINCAMTANNTKTKVLLVDDDPQVIETVRVALESNGYEMLVARDGNQALAMAERDGPGLMILDMVMPRRSGLNVLQTIRRNRAEPLPVIMVTANGSSRHKAFAETLGVSDYLCKPFDMNRLVESVKRALTHAAVPATVA
jgi:DNA-binding response OmpR family regulator